MAPLSLSVCARRAAGPVHAGDDHPDVPDPRAQLSRLRLRPLRAAPPPSNPRTPSLQPSHPLPPTLALPPSNHHPNHHPDSLPRTSHSYPPAHLRSPRPYPLPPAQVLHLRGVRMGDTQATATGLATALFFLFVSGSRPLHRLSPRRPPASVLAPYVFFSVLAQFAVHLGLLIQALPSHHPSLTQHHPHNMTIPTT